MTYNLSDLFAQGAFLALVGCGSGAISAGGDASHAPDTMWPSELPGDGASSVDSFLPDDSISPDGVGELEVTVLDALDDASPEAPDAASDVDSDLQPDPAPCGAGTACGMRLDAQGRCAIACIPQLFGLDCDGAVVGGLCFTGPPPPTGVDLAGTTEVVEWSVAVPSLGATFPGDLEVPVGEAVSVVFTGTNPSAKAVKVDVFLDVSGRWSVEQSDLASGSITVPAGATVDVTATLRAIQSNAVEPWEWRVATAYLGERVITLFGRVADSGGAGTLCGGRAFPTQWCPNGDCSGPTGGFYVSAVCCDGVYYPGSRCCADADCAESNSAESDSADADSADPPVIGVRCVDGRCLTESPALSMANDAPVGRQRALMLITDDPAYAAFDPCTDQVDTLMGPLGLADVEAWFDQVSVARTGRDLLDLDWVVLVGFSSADFASDPYGDASTFLTELSAHLETLGCPQRFDQFDKVVAVSPTVNTFGATAVALPGGRVLSHTAMEPLVIAHELGHTFGASDVYVDLGVHFRYRADLMGNNLGAFGPPRDGVLRGEIGYVDLDGNGVVDVAEFATSPDALALLMPRAVAVADGTLQVSFEIGAREGVEVLRVVMPECTLELVGLVPERHVADAKRRKLVVLAPVATPGQSITIRVRASYTFTTATGTRETLSLDDEAAIVVEAP